MISRVYPCIESLEPRIAPATFVWDGSRKSMYRFQVLSPGTAVGNLSSATGSFTTK